MKKAAKIGGIIVGILLLYVLSIGPAYAWHLKSAPKIITPARIQDAQDIQDLMKSPEWERFGSRQAALNAFYAPVHLVRNRSRVVRKAFDVYEVIWLHAFVVVFPDRG